MATTHQRQLSKSDIAVFGLALVGVILLYPFFYYTKVLGSHAVISVAGKVPQKVDLSRNQLIRIQGPLGQSVLEIRQGAIRFRESPCPQKYCIHSGWSKHQGDLLACLPNRVRVTIEGLNSTYDTINF